MSQHHSGVPDTIVRGPAKTRPLCQGAAAVSPISRRVCARPSSWQNQGGCRFGASFRFRFLFLFFGIIVKVTVTVVRARPTKCLFHLLLLLLHDLLEFLFALLFLLFLEDLFHSLFCSGRLFRFHWYWGRVLFLRDATL